MFRKLLWRVLSPAKPKLGDSSDADLPSQLGKLTSEVFADIVIQKEDDVKKNWAERILAARGFENGISVFIVLNLVVMVIETDRGAMQDSEERAADSGIHWTIVFGWVALTVFVLEMLVRLFAHGCLFWQDPWNVWDFAVVLTDVGFSIVGRIVDDLFPVSILRVFRLTKLARVSKVLRIFPELRLLLAGMLSSVRAIFWGTLLLFLFLLIWSMVAVQLIYPLSKNIDYGDCERCARAYSSVMQATLTFWQQIITGDSWGQATIPIIEEHPSTAFFFLPVFMSIGMALMNLILGVVINAAQTAYEDLQDEEKAERALFKLEKQSKVLKLCRQLDVDRSGELSHEELFAGFKNAGDFQDYLFALDLTEEDFEIAWATMDTNKSGSVSYKEFVTYLATMKSSDVNFMLAYVKFYVTCIRETLMEQIAKGHEEAVGEESILKDTLDIVEHESQPSLVAEQEGEEILEEQQEVVSELTKHNQMAEQAAQNVQAKSEQEVTRVPGNPLNTKKHAIHKKVVENPLLVSSSDATKVEHRPSGHVKIDGSGSIKPANMNDIMQVLLQQISNDVGKLRVELNDTWMHMNHKLDLHGALASSTRDDREDATKVDTWLVPSKHSSCGNPREIMSI